MHDFAQHTFFSDQGPRGRRAERIDYPPYRTCRWVLPVLASGIAAFPATCFEVGLLPSAALWPPWCGFFSSHSAMSNMRMSCGGNSNSMPQRRAPCVPCWPSPCSAWRSAFGSCFARRRRAQPRRPSRKSTRRGRSPPNSHVPTPFSRSWETRASSSRSQAAAS